MDPTLAAFSGGVIAAGYAVAAVFFLRFFGRTRDWLFVAFAVAFLLMALNQTLQVVLDIPREDQSPIFLLRLSAFLLIIAAVLRKNLGARGRRP
jgi:membrane-associated PAP2 superfamily phosphatase